MSLDVVLASTSDRPRQHEFRSPRLQRAPKRRAMSIDGAEPRPEAQQATCTTRHAPRFSLASFARRLANAIDAVRARRARRLLRRRAGRSACAVLRSNSSRSRFSRSRAHLHNGCVDARAVPGINTNANMRTRVARRPLRQPSGEASAAPAARERRRTTPRVDAWSTSESIRERARRSRRLHRLRMRLRYLERHRTPFRSPLEAGAPELMLSGAIGCRRVNDVERHGFPVRAAAAASRGEQRRAIKNPTF